MKVSHATTVLALALIAGSAAADESKGDWQFSITPYVWLPTISGDLNYDPPPDGGDTGGPGIDVGPTDWLDLLNGAALVGGSARKGRFLLQGDFIYLGLKSEKDKVVAVGGGSVPVDATLNVSTQTKFDGVSWSLAAGYALSSGGRSSADLFAGVRFLSLDVTANWDLEADITAPGGEVVLPSQGSRTVGVELTDVIAGVQGSVKLGAGRWNAKYYLDVGSGSSDLTWQAMAGVEYSYGWGDVLLMYRHLDYDEGSNELLRNLTLSGPIIGARFRF